ncbi:hypothetical protein SDC9_144126 [bioreactor metagenome]|uniref:Uncharacterized protein n=1 Tax=bioreactor metagenome TaxID=1076179 RepID=A0A645E5Z6_9ZZZZ
MGQCLDDAEVCVVQRDVLAYEGDANLAVDIFSALDHSGPFAQVGLLAVEAEAAAGHVREPGFFQHQRHLVEYWSRQVGDGVFLGDVAEERNFIKYIAGYFVIAAAHDNVRLDSDSEKLLAAVLGGFALKLSASGDGNDERNVYEHDILTSDFLRDLAYCLEERLGFDVADGSAYLGDDDVSVLCSDGEDALLYLVGNVGDYLYGAAEVVAGSLAVEHAPVYLAGGDRRIFRKVFVNKPFVMSKVEIGLGAVVGDEDLAVLIRTHGSGIDV